jgi:cytochrome c553
MPAHTVLLLGYLSHFLTGGWIMEKGLTLTIVTLALVQAACGGGGSGSSTSVSPSATGASIAGTVPGTLIEAFGDNGSYHAVDSSDNGTARHPFQLQLPAGVGFHLVMTTNDGTPDEVVTPIGFRDSSGRVRTRLMVNDGETVDLGHVPLPMGRNAAATDDRDNDGVLDSPMILDDVGASNPLSQADADNDGMDDWDDPDHGGYHYADHIKDPQDHDDDGIPNSYDHDHQARSDDSDADGLPDSVDANRHNERDHANDDLGEDCDHDGYNDDDHDRDGFHDDDGDRDGYHDDDLDHDGHHDGEDDHEDRDNTGSCSGAPTPTQPTPTQPAPIQTAPTQPAPTQAPGPDGQALYTSFCARCHGPTGVRGSSASAISSAIAGDVGGMGSLSSLTSAEIQAIASYLAQ